MVSAVAALLEPQHRSLVRGAIALVQQDLPPVGRTPERAGAGRRPHGARRAALGGLLVAVPAPLAIGTVEFAGGTSTLGFVREAAGAEDITAHGGWRGYLVSRG